MQSHENNRLTVREVHHIINPAVSLYLKHQQLFSTSTHQTTVQLQCCRNSLRNSEDDFVLSAETPDPFPPESRLRTSSEEDDHYGLKHQGPVTTINIPAATSSSPPRFNPQFTKWSLECRRALLHLHLGSLGCCRMSQRWKWSCSYYESSLRQLQPPHGEEMKLTQSMLLLPSVASSQCPLRKLATPVCEDQRPRDVSD